MNFQKTYAPRKSNFYTEKQLNRQTTSPQGDSPQTDQFQANLQPDSISLFTDPNSRIEPSIFVGSAASKDLLISRAHGSSESNVNSDNVSANSEQISSDQKPTTPQSRSRNKNEFCE